MLALGVRPVCLSRVEGDECAKLCKQLAMYEDSMTRSSYLQIERDDFSYFEKMNSSNMAG